MPSSTLELTQFVTSSADKTIRVWNLPSVDIRKLENVIIRNVYNRDLSQIIYVSETYAHFKNFKSLISDDEFSIRCIAVSPDSTHIASGDMVGVLRVHRLSDLGLQYETQAHDSEITCIDYSGRAPTEVGPPVDPGKYLVSGSRDRLLHIFDAKSNYDLHNTVYDHAATINDA